MRDRDERTVRRPGAVGHLLTLCLRSIEEQVHGDYNDYDVEDEEDEGENGEHLTPLHQHEEEINEYMKERGQI